MIHYLSNLPKEEGLADKVERAAKLSGLDVRLIDGPMPSDEFLEIEGYKPEEAKTYDCVACFDDRLIVDCSAFWKEFKNI